MGKKRKKRQNKKTAKKFQDPFSDLIIAVDLSRKKKTMFSLVSIREHNLPKLQTFTWLKRVSNIKDSKAKRHHIKKFPEKFNQVKPHLEDWKISPDLREIEAKITTTTYKLAIIDDNILKSGQKRGIYYPREKHLPESIGKKIPKYQPLVNTADNLAFVGRVLYEESKTLSEFKRKLKKLGL